MPRNVTGVTRIAHRYYHVLDRSHLVRVGSGELALAPYCSYTAYQLELWRSWVLQLAGRTNYLLSSFLLHRERLRAQARRQPVPATCTHDAYSECFQRRRRERDPKVFDGAAMRARKDFKHLYVGLRLAPGKRTQAILYDDAPPADSRLALLKCLAHALPERYPAGMSASARLALLHGAIDYAGVAINSTRSARRQ
jgi:hypothetical protein